MPIIAAVMATSELRFGFPVAASAAVVFGCNNDISGILLSRNFAGNKLYVTYFLRVTRSENTTGVLCNLVFL
jgi:hypothetical protein